MSKTLSTLACSVAGSVFSFAALALPGPPAPAGVSAPEVLQVRDFCGLGFHRGPYGQCRPNGVPYGYVAAPVVVAQPAVVVPRAVCPYGYYYYAPYGRCVPTP
jgi:hypothetical protein